MTTTAQPATQALTFPNPASPRVCLALAFLLGAACGGGGAFLLMASWSPRPTTLIVASASGRGPAGSSSRGANPQWELQSQERMGTQFPGDGPIDINTASAEALDRLPGIGPVLLQRIIEARERTPFRTVEDLRRVPGIGPKTLQRLRPLVIVRPPSVPVVRFPSTEQTDP